MVLKARGWRWGRSIGCWYVREVGHTVEVVVSEQLRSPAEVEVEADKVARQDDREAALAERPDRKHAAATVAEQRARELADMVPFGQPEKKLGRGSRRDTRGFRQMDPEGARDWAEAEQPSRCKPTSTRP